MRGTLIITAVAVWPFVAWAAAQPSKPVKESVSQILVSPVPSSLEDMVAETDAVVLGRLVHVTVEEDPRLRYLTTVYTFEVLEVLKGGGLIPASEVRVVLPGGEKDYGDYVKRHVTKPSARPLSKGRTYVVMLGWNPYLETVVPRWGGHAVFDVTEPRVSTQSDLAEGYEGLPSTEFLSRVRRR